MALLTRDMFPAPSEAPESELRGIPSGFAGIAATLDYMVALTRRWRTDLRMRRLAESLVAGVQSKSWLREAQAIYDWVHGTVRYTGDVADVETVKTPWALVTSPFGDCDDMSVLAGTLLSTLGHPVRYVAVSTQPGVEQDHVFVETRIGKRWIALDATESYGLGWAPEPQFERMVRHV